MNVQKSRSPIKPYSPVVEVSSSANYLDKPWDAEFKRTITYFMKKFKELEKTQTNTSLSSKRSNPNRKDTEELLLHASGYITELQ